MNFFGKTIPHIGPRRKLAKFVAVALLVQIAILAVAACAVNAEYGNAIDRGVAAAKSDLLVVRRVFDAMLQRASILEANALVVQSYYEKHNPEFENKLEDLRQQIRVAGGDFLQVTFSDSTGIIKWSTHDLENRTISIADRDYFQALRSGSADSFIGKANIGRLTNILTLPISTRLQDAQGNFKGIVTIRLNADMARTLLNLLPSNENSMVAFIRDDGEVVSRAVNLTARISEPPLSTIPKIVSKVVKDDGFNGVVTSPVDGITRFVATAYKSELHLILLVASEVRPALEELAPAYRRVIYSTVIATLLNALGLFLVLRLVWRQQKIEQELLATRDVARREAVLVQVADKANDMIALLDSEFRYVYINEAFHRQLGIDIKKSIGKRMGHSHARLPDQEASMEKLAREGGSARFMAEVPHVNGGTRWLEVELVAVDIRVDDYVSPYRYIGIARDVTERVIAEQKVSSSQQRLEHIFSVSPGFSYEIWSGAYGDVTIDVPVAIPERLLGYSMEEATKGGMFWEQTLPEDQEQVRRARSRWIDTGSVSVEFSVRASDGSTRRLLSQVNLTHKDEHGARGVGFISDITSEYSTRLRLRHSEQLAVLGMASANIAHDMNQPLATLLLAVENAMLSIENAKATPERLRAKLATIEMQANRLSQMVNNVRKFSRDDHGSNSVFPLSRAIQVAVDLSEMRIRTVGAEIEISLQPDLPDLHADILVIQQIIINLIVNACDAYETGPNAASSKRRVIKISAEHEAGNLIIRVADFAGGIAPAIMPLLFSAFVTSKPPEIGTGLGLSICAGHVRTLGGQISALNQDGGAVFEISLPQDALYVMAAD